MQGGKLLAVMGAKNLALLGAAYIAMAIYDALKEEEVEPPRKHRQGHHQMMIQQKWTRNVLQGLNCIGNKVSRYIQNLKVKRPQQHQRNTQRRTAATIRRKRKEKFRNHKRNYLAAYMALTQSSAS